MCLILLLRQRGFYEDMNLSSTEYQQFKIFLLLLQIDEIELVAIDFYS